MRKEAWFGLSMMAIVVALVFYILPAPSQMTNGHLGLLMLGMIVVAIMLGFPTAFTLMGLGTLFAFFAYYSVNPATALTQTLDLMALRAYWVMNNDVLISVPLFVFMGYLVERSNLIGKLFKSLHLATSRIPGSLAVATIVTCAIFATASGIIGAVVTLMGLLAFPAMLKAGYGVRLAAGSVTAGGTLGILIPPSVLLILYGATAGVSVVQLYAGAFFPGFMLAGLYVGYVIVYAKLKPNIAPPLSEEDQCVYLPQFAEIICRTKSNNVLAGLIRAIKGKRNADVHMRTLLTHMFIALLPMLAVALLLGSLYLVGTAPEHVVPESVQVMGFAATGSEEAEVQVGGLQEPEGSEEQEAQPVEASQENEQLLRALSETLDAPVEKLLPTTQRLLKEWKDARSENKRLIEELASLEGGRSLGQRSTTRGVNGVKFVAQRFPQLNIDRMITTASRLVRDEETVVAFFHGQDEKTVRFVVLAGKQAVRGGVNANEIANEAARLLGGGGSGRPEFAQGGGSRVEKIEDAVTRAEEVLTKQLRRKAK
jgi:hypothetical protein